MSGNALRSDFTKGSEFLEADVGVMLGLSMADDIGRRHLIDRFHAAVVPYFFKPAANQTRYSLAPYCTSEAD